MTEVIRKRYEQNTVNKLRKLDYWLREAQINLDFIINCNSNSAVPKFLNFCVATNSLNFSISPKKLNHVDYFAKFELF